MATMTNNVISGKLKKDMKFLFESQFKRLFFMAIVAMLFIQPLLSFANEEADFSKEKDFLKAALTGDVATVEKLLQEGVKIDLQNPDGFTALAVASQNGHTAVVNLLLEKNAAFDLRNVQGGTALLLASKNGHETIVEALLAKGA